MENLNTENEYDRLEETEAEGTGEALDPIEAEPGEEAELVQPASADGGQEDLVLARVNRAPYYRGGQQYGLGQTLLVPRYVLENQTTNPPHLVAADTE